MGAWDKIKAAFSKRQDTGLEVSRWQTAPPRKGTAELLRAYQEMPWLQAVVRKISSGVASARWRVYSRQEPDPAADGKMARVRDYSFRRAAPRARRGEVKALLHKNRLVDVPDHPMLALLANPNSYQSGNTFLRLLQTYLDLVGEAFIAVEWRGDLPISLWLTPPSAVIRLPPQRSALGAAPDDDRTYHVNFGGKVFRVPTKNMVHLRDPDPNDPLGRGIGPGFSLGDELDSLEYASIFAKNFLYNFGMPAAVASIEGMNEASGPAVKAFVEQMNRSHKGPENAGKLLVTTGKVSIARLDTSFKDADMVPHRQYLQDFLRQCYGVPASVLGASASNYAEARTAGLVLAEHVIDPRMEFLCLEFQRAFPSLFGVDETLHYDSPVPTDREHVLKVAMAAPWSRSVNEWRELQDLEPDPQFDGVYPPLAMPGQSVGDAEGEEGEDGEEKPEEKPDPAKKKLAPGDPPWAIKPIQ